MQTAVLAVAAAAANPPWCFDEGIYYFWSTMFY